MPVGQSAVVWQPQARMPEPKFSHLGPSDAFVQSVLLLHPQVPPLHAAPFALIAQSLLVMHWTQEFVAQ